MFNYRYPVVITSPNGVVNFQDISLGDLSCEVAFVDQMDGWTNTARPVVITSQKAIGDGASIASRFYAQGRQITIGGLIATSSELENEQAWDNLSYLAFPWNQDLNLEFVGPEPKYVTTRVISDLRITQWNPTGFRFEIDVLCADPYKYDAVNILSGASGIAGASSGGMTFPSTFPMTFTTTASGSSNGVTLINTGNAPTNPQIIIFGQVDQGWRIENTVTGKFISFDISATSASDQILLDHATETAYYNGTPITGLVNGDWWPLEPKINTIKLFGNYYSATVFTVTARSAWR